jgi:hypothetical protein
MPDISDRPWSGVTRASYATAAEYCAACLIDENPSGTLKTKSRCKLPVCEPRALGGRLNRNAVHAAADRLVRTRRGVEASVGEHEAAARRLIELFQEIGDRPPRTVIALAGSRVPQAPATGSCEVLVP